MKVFQQNLDKLHYFYAVAKNESFHAAAKELHISQPSLSYAVKELEKILNLELLKRDRSGTRTTPEGRILMDLCDNIFSDLSLVERAILDAGETPAGKVEFGTYDVFVGTLWPECYSNLISKYPKLDLKLTAEADRENIIEGLVTRKFDMATVAGVVDASGIDGCKLYSDSVGFFVSSKKSKVKWLKSVDLSIKELNKLPLIYERLEEPVNSKSFFHNKLLEYGIDTPPIVSVRGIETVRTLTVQGLGVGVLPYKHVKKQLMNKSLIELNIAKLKKGTLCPHDNNLFWQSSLTGSKAIGLIKDTFCEVAKKIYA